ncbi:potassium transporter TrkA [Acidianus sulfidivorans JP7]|uniref:Potassium transporter TrkA n=1 Tax=Acidianus sulfidivorans JP7 TaxID=619593 RepID=A0A2U9ILC2_9CREN|nr:NAD-binding protein [Acidianus sulfidivorans]AWR96724.1 potassium transporter TrkA [Acidianus sulfidivorans JP7]
MNTKRIWNNFIMKLMENLVAPYSVIRKIFPQLFMLGIAVYVNSLVFMIYQHLDFISALYAGVNVVTTVGLYAPNINQLSSTEKIILIITMIFAVGLYTSILQSVVTTVVNRSTWIDAKARWRGSHMHDHTILIGKGEVITSAAKRLERLKVDYIILTTDKNIKDIDPDKIIIADPKEDKNLLEAGVLNAKNAIVCMEDDMETLLITLKIQKLNPPLQVISVVKNSSLVDAFKTAGADVIIPYDDIVGRITASAAISNHVAGLILQDRLNENLVIGVFDVKKSIKISDLPEGVIPLIVVKENGKLDPFFEKDYKLKEGEKIIILGDPKVFEKIKEMLE